MSHIFHHTIFVILVTLSVATTRAQERDDSPFSGSLYTVAGLLKVIVHEESCRYEVVLNGKRIWHSDCHATSSAEADMPIPTIHTYYKQGVQPFAEVILMQQQMVGNACNGGPLWFIGLYQDGSYALSQRIAFCGGRQPIVTWSENKITVVLPGGPPHRGTRIIPTVTWVYENGQVKQTKVLKRPK